MDDLISLAESLDLCCGVWISGLDCHLQSIFSLLIVVDDLVMDYLSVQRVVFHDQGVHLLIDNVIVYLLDGCLSFRVDNVGLTLGVHGW